MSAALHKPCPRYRALAFVTAVAFLLCTAAALTARARNPRKSHVVQQGESVAKIADFYGVSQRDLRELNKLRKGAPLRVGQELKIPHVLRVQGKSYKVKPGDSLASIAAKHKRSTKEVAHANKLSLDAPLRIGQTLVIPDRNSKSKAIRVKEHTIKPVAFLRVRTGERKRLQLYRKNGEVNKRAVMQLSHLARDKIGGKVKRLNYGLIKMIQLVAEEFPDTPFEIISGYRSQADGEETQHAFGRAMDFRIPGVPTNQVFRFCKSLPRSGCGHYPRSGFIHMDSREKKASWTE